MSEKVVSRGQRAAWTFAGQGLSSLSNFLVAVWALMTVTAPQFAALSLCLTTYLLVAQLGRDVVSVPVLVLHSAEPGTAIPPGACDALGASVTAGMAAGALIVLGAASVDQFGTVDLGLFLVLAAALPLLLYQDTLRHVCIARHRPSLAAASDASWLVLQVAGFAVLAATGRPSAVAVLTVWAGAGAAAGVWLGAVLHAWPRVGQARSWLRTHRVLCSRLLLEFTVNSGSYYVVAYGIALLAGAAQLGHLRAAQALFGPASVLLIGGTVLGVAECVRARHDEGGLRRFAFRLSAGLALLSLLAGAALYLAVPVFGPRFMAGLDRPVRSLLPLLTLFGAAIGVAAGPLAALRAKRDDAWILRAKASRAVGTLLVGLPSAAAFGANGGLFGLAVAECVFAVAVWARFTSLRIIEAPADIGPSPAAGGELVVAGAAGGGG